MRAIYWMGFRFMRAVWFLLRPRHRGALVAVWVGDRVLVLRQSYRRDLNLPGGSIKRDESPVDAAVREVHEEVGLTLDPASLRLAWEQQTLWDWRQDHVTIFEATLDTVPDLFPDGREVVEARLISPLAVLAGPKAPFFENYLLHRMGRAPAG